MNRTLHYDATPHCTAKTRKIYRRKPGGDQRSHSAELIPPLHLSRQNKLIALLKDIERWPITPHWEDLVQLQITCLNNGINGIGIPDLIIAQNAIQHDLQLLTRDKHFGLLSAHMPLSLYGT